MVKTIKVNGLSASLSTDTIDLTVPDRCSNVDTPTKKVTIRIQKDTLDKLIKEYSKLKGKK